MGTVSSFEFPVSTAKRGRLINTDELSSKGAISLKKQRKS
jgi:hypothetical protein